MNKTKKLILLSLLVTLAVALHTVEIMIPNPIPLPGFKLGLANVVTLVVMGLYGLKEALGIAVLRVVFASLLTGTFLSVTFLMSLSGAVVSTVVMILLKRCISSLKLIHISIVGAITHNLAQLTVAYFLVKTLGILIYLPFLIAVGIPVGILTGIIANRLLKYSEFQHQLTQVKVANACWQRVKE